MIRGFWARKRKGENCAIESATKPVLEALEGRVLMSGSGLATGASAAASRAAGAAAGSASTSSVAHPNVSAATLSLRPRMNGLYQTSFPTNVGFTVDQFRHLYGLDTLDAFNPSLPLYTNSGAGQFVAIIGSDPGQWLLDVPNKRAGNLTRFDAAMNVNTNGGVAIDTTLAPTITFGNQTIINEDFLGAAYSTGMIEWTHAFAPQSEIIAVDIPTDSAARSFGGGGGGGGGGGNLTLAVDSSVYATNANILAGIQEAINQLAPVGGGVIMNPFQTFAEDPTAQAQYEALYAEAAAKNISFIAPVGDKAGAVSSIAASPNVLAVGGTVPVTDAAGNRQFETAWVRTGGGPSSTFGEPAYQVGIVPTRAGHKAKRGTPDLALGAIGRQSGYGFFFDDTPDLSDKFPWGLIQSSSGGSAIMAGAVTDANELRFTERLGTVGVTLPAQVYNAYKIAPNFTFTDLTLGNNTYQAGIGWDYATGLGAPKLDGLVSSLGNVVGSSGVNTRFNGDLFFNFSTTQQKNLVVPFVGTGSASFGPFNVGVSFTLTSPSSLATGTITIPLLARNIDGTVTGQGTAHVVVPPTITGGTTYTADFPVLVTGTIGRAHKRDIISGTIVTIDAQGNPVQRGANDVFQGTFKSI